MTRHITFINKKTLNRMCILALRHYTMTWGIAMLLLMILIAIAAPIISYYDPLALNPYERLISPSRVHWFGTDELGRDIYSRTIYGARVSLIVGGMATSISVILGLLFGLVSAYYRMMDMVIMRLMDSLMALPTLLLAIALMAVLGSSLQNVIIALAIVQAPRTTRVMRASALVLKEAIFVEAARAIGAKSPRILLYHILPNAIAPIIVQATFLFAQAILVEAALSFLGAGSSPIIASWGNILSEGRAYIHSAIWITLFPGFFLTMTVLGVNLIGDGLRDLLDPKLRGRL